MTCVLNTLATTPFFYGSDCSLTKGACGAKAYCCTLDFFGSSSTTIKYSCASTAQMTASGGSAPSTTAAVTFGTKGTTTASALTNEKNTYPDLSPIVPAGYALQTQLTYNLSCTYNMIQFSTLMWTADCNSATGKGTCGAVSTYCC